MQYYLRIKQTNMNQTQTYRGCQYKKKNVTSQNLYATFSPLYIPFFDRVVIFILTVVIFFLQRRNIFINSCNIFFTRAQHQQTQQKISDTDQTKTQRPH